MWNEHSLLLLGYLQMSTFKGLLLLLEGVGLVLFKYVHSLHSTPNVNT